MTKREVCEYLGKSKRTVEGYMLRGHLNVEYILAPNGRVAVFDRVAVRKFKKDWAERWRYQSLADKGLVQPADAIAMTVRPRPAKPLAIAAPAAPVDDPVAVLGAYVTLDEAAKRSGMPKSWLIAQAKAGATWAVNVSGSEKREVWRFRVARETEGGGIIRGS
jgi:hypothetical protein